MNTLKKIFCRTFQKVMHVLIPIFPYREPAILDGIGEIVELLKKKNKERVLLVTDRGVRSLGLTTPLENLLDENGISCTIYDGTMPNPTSDNVEEARALYVNNDCQALIAFGGGSDMDCAKGIGARIARPNMPLKKMAGLIKIRKSLPLFIAIPTTAGTGSETTVAAVITDATTHHKYVINDFCLIPGYASLAPEVTASLPKHLTSTTGMDALTHAVEAYIGKSTTKGTRAASEKAVKLIFENLEKAYCNGADLDARKNMLRASYLAGTAFTKSYVGYVHAVAHSLGGKYGVPHGLANAVILPHALRAYGEAAHKPLASLARVAGLADNSICDTKAAELFISHVEGMNERMGIPTKLDCIKREDISAMATLADKEANPLYPVPVLWDAEELEALYLSVYDEANDDKSIEDNSKV